VTFTARIDGVETAQMLNDTIVFLRRFIAFPADAQPTAIALWIAHTHAIEAAAHWTPYLNIESAEKRSGKSRLLEVIGSLVRDPIQAVNMSEAVLFRMLGSKPTLLVDEIDALFASGTERTEALRGILNAGNRVGADVYRAVGPNHVPTPFPVFSPKALAGINNGRLPETVRDRSITLRLKRRAVGESVERLLWPKVQADADALRERIAAWGAQHPGRLTGAEPDLPGALDDRAADGWWPLLAIADLAGHDWPANARKAAVDLHADGAADDESRSVRLVTDLRVVFGKALAVSTADLLGKLNGLDESPWGGWHEGKGMRARDLARILKPFGVAPKKVNVGGVSLQGYHRDDLEDAWTRYLPPPPGESPERPEPSRCHRGFEVPNQDEVPEPQMETEPEIPHSNGDVPDVPQVPHPFATEAADPDVARAEALAEKYADMHNGDGVEDLFAGVASVRRPRREAQ
jgi:hypothetical protein